MAWMIIAAQAISSIISANSASKQNESQLAWNRYNAEANYNTALTNIAARSAISQANAAMAMATGRLQANASLATAETNANIIWATTVYNDRLLAEELDQMWNAEELDQGLLAKQRAVERGGIEAQQAASGTVMGQDSNADVIIDQKTAEALDSFVIRHNADIKAAEISNARAKGLWEGNMAVKKTLWEGNLAANMSLANSKLQAAGMITESIISNAADRASAISARDAGMAGADTNYNQNNTQIGSSLLSGLFNTGAQAASDYYGRD